MLCYTNALKQSSFRRRKTVMRLILHYVGRYKALVLLNILSVFGFALAELGTPPLWRI